MWYRLFTRRLGATIARAFTFGRRRRLRRFFTLPRSSRPSLETLEDRTLLSIDLTSFVVPPTGLQGQTLSFSANTTDSAGAPLTYNWDFGTGNGTAQGAVVTYSFNVPTAPGQPQPITLIIDDGTDTLTANGSVEIDNVPPTVTLVADHLAVTQGAMIPFVAAATDHGEALSVAWDFAYDGTTFHPDSSAAGSYTPTHTYATAGSFQAAVQVTDLGRTGPRCLRRPVTVHPP